MDHAKLHRGARRHRADLARQLARIADSRAIERGNDVATRDAGVGRRAVRLRLRDERAGGLLQAEAVGDLGRDRLDLDADPPAGDGTLVAQLGDDALHRLGGDSESNTDRAAGGREDRGVDADDITVDIKGRAAGIPFVDRRIDLDEVVIGTGADVAAARRHDAGSHGAPEAEGIAYRNHPVTDARRMVGKLHVREVVAVDLDQSEVGALIGADDLGRIGLAVVSRDLNVLGVLHDVIVGDGVAVGGDEETGTLARDELVAATLAVVGHAKPLEETLERRAGWERQFVIAEPGLGRPLHLDPHRDHRGFDLLHDVAEADGLLRKLLSLLGQILRMRGTGEEISLRRRVRREEGCGAETGDSRRQQRHAPRGQAAA